jgi:hypothetical protein
LQNLPVPREEAGEGKEGNCTNGQSFKRCREEQQENEREEGVLRWKTENQGMMPGASVAAAKEAGKSWLRIIEKFPAVHSLNKE